VSVFLNEQGIPPKQKKCTLFVCTSCRPTGYPREPQENRPGFQLHQKISDALEGSDLKDLVNVEAAQCLSLCPRQDPENSVASILECVSIYLSSHQGEMSRGVRPVGLRESILGRIPPQTKLTKMEPTNE
jgi:predicted metal-binding protein